ncbi:MAG: hypothetical protein J7J03_00800 [Methanosarcinales archaeon]|nr:hypothetical protein [Methanosarcinales archaeon]
MNDTSEDFEELDAAVLAESEKSRAHTVLICPQCGSRNVTYWLGLKAGCQYQCKDCGYVGAFVIEG